MFNIPFQCSMTGYQGTGAVGEQEIAVTLVASAEDALWTRECVGEIGAIAYTHVKSNKLGSPVINMPADMLCSVAIFSDGNKVIEVNQVRVSKLQLVSSTDPNNPPKAKMVLNHRWSDEELPLLAKCLKKDLTVEVKVQNLELFPQVDAPKSVDPKKRQK